MNTPIRVVRSSWVAGRSRKLRGQSPSNHLAFVVSVVGLLLMTLAWPVQAQPQGQSSDPATPSRTPTLAANDVGITLYLPPNPPTASIRVGCGLPGDEGWCRMPVQVTLLGNAAGSPIGRLDYGLDGHAFSETADAYAYEDGVNGTHALSLTATDRLGRVSAPVNQTYQVDGSLPVAAFNGAVGNGLSLSISDEGSGVRRWTVQVFNPAGQSVFYREGTGSFDGVLDWSAPADFYQVELFVRDVAGNESHFPRTLFIVPTPTAESVVQQVFGFLAPAPTALPAPSPQTPGPVSSPTPAASVTPGLTRVPTQSLRATNALVVPTLVPQATSPQPERARVMTSFTTRWLALATLLALLLAWATSAALDRRASAVRALAEELYGLRSSRLDGTHPAHA